MAMDYTPLLLTLGALLEGTLGGGQPQGGIVDPGASQASTGALPDWVPPRYQSPIMLASQQSNVPAALLASLLKQESGFNPNAQSPVGARGIAQFMPGTARQYGVNTRDPVSSIMGAAKLLSALHGQFGDWSQALAGYNAGPGAVQKYGGVPPYAETQNYVRNIMQMAGNPQAQVPPLPIDIPSPIPNPGQFGQDPTQAMMPLLAMLLR